ncbi:MAG TPA: hypothetical protein VGM31_00245, partial [Puia sp.]
MMVLHRLKGNALFITVVIALIIGVLCSLLLLLAYNNMQMDRHFNTESRLEKNMRSATNLVMADTSLILGQQETSLDLYDGSADSATIKKANWGMYSFAAV